MYDKSKIVRLMARVREVANQPFVLTVSDHFAGYFDELGITIAVKPDTSAAQIVNLKDRISPVLASAQLPCKWMVMFTRGAKSVGELFPDGLFTGEMDDG
jgi:hypothetical protein